MERRPLALDANILIRAVEGAESDPLSASCRHLVFERSTPIAFIVSELTLAEVLVVPMRDDNRELIRFYRRLLTDLHTFRMVAVTRAVLLDAARLRSLSALKLPDAIHLATATRAGCRAFVTLDKALFAPGAVPAIRPDDPAIG